VRAIESEFTAQAYITTDLDNNQITAFHPGAMNHSHRNSVDAARGIRIGIVSPDGRQGMIDHAAQFAAAGIPFMFDPGQGLPMFDGAALRAFIAQASWIAVNDYEASLLVERTGDSLERIAAQVEALIVTLGAEGSRIYTKAGCLAIPPAKPRVLADPTGCGDAYRAGLLYGLQRGFDWALTGRIASLMGAIKMEHHGTQHHRLTQTEFRSRYRDNFDSFPE